MTKLERLTQAWRDKVSLLRIVQHEEQMARAAMRAEELRATTTAAKDCYVKAGRRGFCGRHARPMKECC